MARAKAVQKKLRKRLQQVPRHALHKQNAAGPRSWAACGALHEAALGGWLSECGTWYVPGLAPFPGLQPPHAPACCPLPADRAAAGRGRP